VAPLVVFLGLTLMLFTPDALLAVDTALASGASAVRAVLLAMLLLGLALSFDEAWKRIEALEKTVEVQECVSP